MQTYSTPYKMQPAPQVQWCLDGTQSEPFQAEYARYAKYPDATELERAYAQWVGVPPQWVLATAGADDALLRFCGLFDAALMHSPTFEMLERWLPHGRRLPWLRGNLEVPYSTAPILFLVSPNNPTGLAIPVEKIEEIAQNLPHTLVVVDHAYIEFADTEAYDATALSLRYPNVAIVRTLSKAWGVPALRVGFVCAQPKLLDRIRTKPYALAGPAVALATNLINGFGDELEAHTCSVKAARSKLQNLLKLYAIETWDSEANFVLARFAKNPQNIFRRVAVRTFPHIPALENCARITVAEGGIEAVALACLEGDLP